MHRQSVFFINEKKDSASAQLAHILKKCILQVERPWSDIVFICIGSDRITGDSLGPMIGHQLSRFHWDHVYIYGTLDFPIHALNLTETLKKLKTKHPSALFIAIDASLGSKKHVGYITVGIGPLLPGAGVHKNLPPVGDLSITGILNVSGAFEHFMLQTTRLSCVVQMADTITDGIAQVFCPSENQKCILPDSWCCPEETLPIVPVKTTGFAALSIEFYSGNDHSSPL